MYYSKTKIAAIITAIFLVLSIFGYVIYYFGSTEDSAVNEVCLVYSGGTFEEKKFVKVMKPGSTKESVGWGSDTYCYRNDQRSFIGAPGTTTLEDENSTIDAPPVTIVTKDNIQMVDNYQMYFFINQDGLYDDDGGVLRIFHEKLGVKTDAWTKTGWQKMLRTYFQPQVERSMEAAALEYTSNELYSTNEGRQEFQRDVAGRFQQALIDAVGGDYFCGVTYQGPDSDCVGFSVTVGKPDIANTDLVGAIEGVAVANQEVLAQEAKKDVVDAQLLAEQGIIDKYGVDGALRWKALQNLAAAIESGKVQLMVVPDDATVATPTPTTGG